MDAFGEEIITKKPKEIPTINQEPEKKTNQINKALVKESFSLEISGINDKQRDEGLINGITPTKIEAYIANATKSICKITTSNKLGSGFLIKLFKGSEEFFCLMTCEHVITRKMIKQRNKISFFYDSIEIKLKDIELNPDERFIKEFRNLENKDDDIDVTIIEILSRDNIERSFFLSPEINYMYNWDSLGEEDITIIQYPKGDLSYSYGKNNEN